MYAHRLGNWRQGRAPIALRYVFRYARGASHS
nr:MAG TPA: hypothetical protein [Caudoviricetes sp.]